METCDFKLWNTYRESFSVFRLSRQTHHEKREILHKRLTKHFRGCNLGYSGCSSLYPSILHEAGLNALREALDNRKNKYIPTDNLVKMVEFVLKTITLNLMVLRIKQLLGTAIGTKLAPTMPVFLWKNLRVIF